MANPRVSKTPGGAEQGNRRSHPRGYMRIAKRRERARKRARIKGEGNANSSEAHFFTNFFISLCLSCRAFGFAAQYAVTSSTFTGSRVTLPQSSHSQAVAPIGEVGIYLVLTPSFPPSLNTWTCGHSLRRCSSFRSLLSFNHSLRSNLTVHLMANTVAKKARPQPAQLTKKSIKAVKVGDMPVTCRQGFCRLLP